MYPRLASIYVVEDDFEHLRLLFSSSEYWDDRCFTSIPISCGAGSLTQGFMHAR